MKTYHFILVGRVVLLRTEPRSLPGVGGIPHSMEGEVAEIKAISLKQALMQLQQIDKVAGYKIAAIFENGKPKPVRGNFFQGHDTADELIGSY